MPPATLSIREREISLWRRWVRKPQNLLLRRALFQVHLWTGIGVGLYVFLICVSGSILVYRPQLLRALYRQPPVVAVSGDRMTLVQLKEAAEKSYPGYKVTEVRQ